MKHIVVLCEDNTSATFIRRFLYTFTNINKHNIREELSPSGSGSGEQWVRENFPKELEFARKHKIKLIVCTDADTLSVDDRLQSLDRECIKEGVPVRKTYETIAMLIPKRAIETWIECLCGASVNEERKYPHYEFCRDKCETAAREFKHYYVASRQSPPSVPPANFPPSLLRTFAEINRLSL